MDNCCNLYFLSTLSCQLAECLSEQEIAVLSADLTTLGSMLATILAHRALCEPREAAELPVTSGISETSGSSGSTKTTINPNTSQTSGTERQITIV